MTGLPITTLEARHLLADYWQVTWRGHTVTAENDTRTLARVLAGAQVDGICEARPDGVDEPTAFAVLDRWHDRNGRPPSPGELAAALDRHLSPDVATSAIANMRAMVANSKDRRDLDHEQLRTQAEQARLAVVRHTPARWGDILDRTVTDGAGWRDPIPGWPSRAWDARITLAEYEARCAHSTVEPTTTAPPSLRSA